MATVMHMHVGLLGTMSIADLVCQHRDACARRDRFDRIGDDYAAQEADELAMSISAEIRDRLQNFVGVPIEQVLGAL